MNETYVVRYEGLKGVLYETATLEKLASLGFTLLDRVEYANLVLEHDEGIFAYKGQDFQADLQKAISLDEKIRIEERRIGRATAGPGSSGPACPPSPQS
jgi:hypothetical protein